MSEKNPDTQEKVEINEGELIEGLQEEPNYFILKYNEKQDDNKAKEIQSNDNHMMSTNDGRMNGRIYSLDTSRPLTLSLGPTRSTGVYVPPHKLRKLQEEMMKEAESNDEKMQRIKWEMLRKSINEIINKVRLYLLG